MTWRFLILISAVFAIRECNGSNLSKWDITKDPDTRIAEDSEKINITTKENSYAFATVPVPDSDLIRATCEVFPNYSRSNSNGLLLFWDRENWIRFSVVRLDVSAYGGWFAHRGGGYYLVSRMTGGSYSEEVLGTCLGCRPHRLALELAEDGIRFLVMGNEDKWTHYKLEQRREPGLRKAPTRVLVGKIGIDPQNPATSAEQGFKFRAAEAGPDVEFEISHISVEPTTSGRRRFSELEQKELDQPGIDHLGVQEVSGKRDPTYASVCQYFPDMRFYREVIGIKDHPQDIGVGFDGALEFKDHNSSAYWMDPALDSGFFTVDSLRLGRDIRISKRYLLDGNWPAVVCEFQANGLTLRQTAFGYSDGFSLTAGLYGYCSLQVVNDSNQTRTLRIAYSLDPQRLQWELTLPARGRETLFLKAPFDAAKAKAGKISSRDYHNVLSATRKYWNELYSRSIQLELPEKGVSDAFSAWLAYTFINVDKRDGRYFICDGSGFYNEPYGYSEAIYMRALLRLGYFDEARTYLTNQLQCVREDGLFLVNFGATDTGCYLRAFADYLRYTHDRQTIADSALQIKKMAGWIMRQRAASKTDSPVTSGLIHVRPYADHPEDTYAYLTDTYLCKGLEEAGYLMGEINDSSADEIRQEAAKYRVDLLRSMSNAVTKVDGIDLLPMLPEPEHQFKKSDSKADDYYGSNASMLLEIGMLEPRGQFADLIVNMLEQRGGKSLGALAWRHGIDHAYLYGYLLNCLQRNRPREAVLGLYGWMAYGMTRNTYSGAEVTYHRLGDVCATFPHTFSSCEQMRLLLDMLVRPDGDELYLAQALPDSWLEPGKVVAVREAPTPFGKVGYRIKSSRSGLDAEIDLRDANGLKSVYFGLRPPGRKIQKVTVNGKSAEVRDGLLTIDSPAKRNSIRVTWE